MVTAPIGCTFSRISAVCQPCLSVEKLRRPNPPPPIDVNPFLQEQCLLHVKSSLVSAERPVGADRAMAWYHDRKRVCRQGIAHGTGTPGNAQVNSHPAVGADMASGNRIFGKKDHALKRGTAVERHLLKPKTDIGPVDKRRDPPGKIVDDAA